MPSKKQKYNTRFPVGRIKKIMQTDEDVGRVAQAVPVIISKTLELFVHSLLTKTMQITAARKAKTLRPLHMKQCILSESRFDFLKDLVKDVYDESGLDDDSPTPPSTPVPATVISSPSVASLPPTLHSDGRTSSAGISSRDGGESLTASVNVTAAPVGVIVSPMGTTTLPRPPDFLLTTLQRQQPQQNSNFVDPVPPSFHVDKPNFYTEVNPMNLTTNSKRSNSPKPFNQSTTNINKTANVDEDYDT